MMSVTVKFVGALRRVAGKSTMIINCSANFSVKDLLQKIFLDIPEIKAYVISQQADSAITSALILVNDREISVLNGLDTLLDIDGEVVFIPVAHGG